MTERTLMVPAKGMLVMLCFAATSCSSGGDPPREPTPVAATRPQGSPLIRAIEAGDESAALTMIHDGQGIRDAIGRWRTPVTAAIESGNLTVLNALIAAGAPFDPATQAGLYVGRAAGSGRWPMFEFIRSKCPDLRGFDRTGRTALQSLAVGNRTQTQPDADRIAVALIEAGVDPHFCGEGVRAYPKFAPLAMAAMHPYRASLVKTLLDHVDYSPAELDTALAAAGRTGAVESILSLQHARAVRKMPPPAPQILCEIAARYDTSVAVEALIAGGAAPDAAQQKLGRTPLLRAVASGDSAGVNVLLQTGADPALLDGEGRSCLDLIADRLSHGREALSDSPTPAYRPEDAGHEAAGAAVQTAMQAWLVAHPATAARIEAAVAGRPRIVPTPAADPAAAIAAIIAARKRKDTAAVQAMLLLPDDPARRLAVVRRLIATADFEAELPPPRLERIERFGTVAVAHVIVTSVLASSRETLYADVATVQLLALRSGGWLAVADPDAGGGLTAAELLAIEPALRAERERPRPDATFRPASK